MFGNLRLASKLAIGFGLAVALLLTIVAVGYSSISRINATLDDILRRVDKAERAGKLLDEIVPAIGKTSELVQEIAATSLGQSSGAGQINTAMTQLNQIIQQNASSSEELAATAEGLSSQAAQLQQVMDLFAFDCS